MINIWAGLARMKQEFPIDSLAQVNDLANEIYWDESLAGKIVKVIGYEIEDGMLKVVTEAGREYTMHPQEVTRYFESQVC